MNTSSSRPLLLKIICVQAILAMVGSLYYSNFGDPVLDIRQGTLFGGAGLEPCHLCRWARIIMYPIVWLSLMALWKKRTDIMLYIRNISYAGVLLELYHYILQKTTWLDFMSMDAFCTKANPCAASQQVDYLGFITIPFLCLVAFVVIAVCATLYVKRSRAIHKRG